MSIAFSCSCGKKIKAKDEWAGKTVKCPGCGKPAKIPSAGGEPASRAAKPASKAAAVPSPSTKTAKKPAPRKPASDPQAGLAGDIDLLPEEPARKGPIDGVPSDDMFTEEQSQSLTATAKQCPFCKKKIFEGDPICISCGTDLKTGKKIERVRERAPLGPLIKKIVMVLVLVGGPGYGWYWYKHKDQGPKGDGPSVVISPTDAAKAIIRNGKLDDFKAFAKSLSGLTMDQIDPLLDLESRASDSSPEGRSKTYVAAACLAWNGIYDERLVTFLSHAFIDPALSDETQQACLDALYAAATPADKRYLPMPARFAGLEKDLASLPKATDPSVDARGIVMGKADAPTLELQMKGVHLAMLLGSTDRMSRMIDMPNKWPDRKAEILKGIQEITAQTFADETALNEWWVAEGQRSTHKQWVAKRLDPATPIADLRVALRLMAFLLPEAVAKKVDEKSSDDEVKESAKMAKEWCDANADKLAAPPDPPQ